MANLMNLLLHINTYADSSSTSSPSLSTVKWHRDFAGVSIKEPVGTMLSLKAGESSLVFSGITQNSSDGTTSFDLSLKPGSSSTYVLSHNSGTNPAFKTLRNVNFDSATSVTITKNAKLATLSFTGGDLSSVIVGDEIRLDSPFNANNMGKFKIIALTSSSVTIENEISIVETIVLGSDFAKNMIYSTSGVMTGSKIEIKNGFSPVTLGTYEITDVYPNKIEFFSDSSLPNEINILSIPKIYKAAKSFLFLESSTKAKVTINENVNMMIEPMIVGVTSKPGMLLLSSSVYSLLVEASENQDAEIFIVSAE